MWPDYPATDEAARSSPPLGRHPSPVGPQPADLLQGAPPQVCKRLAQLLLRVELAHQPRRLGPLEEVPRPVVRDHGKPPHKVDVIAHAQTVAGGPGGDDTPL